MKIYLNGTNNTELVNFGFVGAAVRGAKRLAAMPINMVTGGLKGAWDGFVKDGFLGAAKGLVQGAWDKSVTANKRYLMEDYLREHGYDDDYDIHNISKTKYTSAYDLTPTGHRTPLEYIRSKIYGQNNAEERDAS